jgi:hypothetical protein
MTREKLTGITDPSNGSAAFIPEGTYRTSGELKLSLIVYYIYCEFKLICYLFACLLLSFVMHFFLCCRIYCMVAWGAFFVIPICVLWEVT